jgi:hypothetical protein
MRCADELRCQPGTPAFPGIETRAFQLLGHRPHAQRLPLLDHAPVRFSPGTGLRPRAVLPKISQGSLFTALALL